MNRLSAIAAFGYLFASGTSAQSAICDNVKGFYNYESHGEFDFTGFFSNPTNIGPCECGPWKYSGNIVGQGVNAVQNWYLDTQGAVSGTETNEMTGVCTEGLRVFDNNVYFFSKEVLERSLNDEGDCKVMLGEQCRNALEMHYLREAVKYIRAGDCPSSGNVEWNNTVPWECAGLVGNSQEWLQSSTASQLWGATPNAKDSLDKVHKDNNCNRIGNPNEHSGENAHLLGSVNVSVNQAVLFPSPTFFIFFPNTTEARDELAKNSTVFDPYTSEWGAQSSNWVQMSCIASNVTQGINVPTVEELLAAIPDDAELPITVEPTPSPSSTATASSGIYPTGGCNSTHGGSSTSATYHIRARSTEVPVTGAASRLSLGGMVVSAVAGTLILAAI